ncbi:hypothetical protein RRG08_051300 [Elysia crispata]|uniref:Reverse transcriptase domain-containing protein n=1 Tax=Elysia crispata TaxID=231223 RepID=A0AAE1CLP2_9GAST|nr:hypothetical protein RRG08_051300 [Elysia crispata]
MKRRPLLGLKSSLTLDWVLTGKNKRPIYVKLVTKETLKADHADVFQGFGYYIELKEDNEPVSQPPRHVTQTLCKSLREKLQETEQRQVNTPVNEPSDRVQNIVIAQKAHKSLRLCLNPKELNKNIKREQFEIPAFEQISAQLGSKTFFSILDQKDSYWQVKLNRSSSYLTKFNTPFGRYHFLMMPFGINSVSEILQKKAFQTFGDIGGVHCLPDDTLIAARNDEEHGRILQKVLTRAREYNVRFDPKKLQFKRHEVK